MTGFAFAHPLIALGTLGIAAPIIIHFIFRRRSRRLEFSAMRFVLLSYKKVARRLMVQEYLLLAARCLMVALLALALAVPLSLYAVNLIGWGYPVITAGTGFHINLKTDGDLSKYIAAQLAVEQAAHPSTEIRTPVYLQKSGWWDDWWMFHFYTATPQSGSALAQEIKKDYLSLDKYTMAYLLADWPNRILLPFIEGCFMQTSSPPGFFGDDDYRPPDLLFCILDGITLIVLVSGLLFSKPRLLAAAALGLWVVTATGNVFGIYVLRYPRTIAMLPFALALLVAFTIIKDVLFKIKDWQQLRNLYKEHVTLKEEV
jgi:hypothetical protein